MTWGLDRVEVRYGETRALDSVTVPVPASTVTAIVGGDGAGKSTALRALVGLVPVAGGAVDRPDVERLGYLPATSGVYPDLTVMENLAFVGSAFRMSGRDVRTRAEELLDRTELGSARDRLGGDLSGGMRQKLGLAMVLLHRPDLLVLDEPTTGIDPVSRAELWRLVAGEAARGSAVVMSTSYLDEAERAAGVVALDRGRVLLSGTADEVRRSVPGLVFDIDRRPDTELRWRRGAGWRVWSPDGGVLPGAIAVDPDLEDAVTVAALRRASEEAA
jgi:ABC-2 type transport system ATP-binding protein